MAAGKGPIVEPKEITEGIPTTRDSYGNYRPGLFGDAMERCNKKKPEEQLQCRKKVQSFAKRFERGRWYEVMDKMHSMIYKFDPAERERFFDRNPHMLKYLRDHARLQRGGAMFRHVDE